MTLSVALAIYNEEKNITSCLDSFYDFADEIIIVDGTSTDNTVEVIKKYDRDHKIKIHVTTNPLMFHINKQKALDRCTKDWILQMDADEHVSKELNEEIIDLLKPLGGESEGLPSGVKTSIGRKTSQDPQKQSVVGYWIPRLNYFLGHPLRKGGQYPDYTLRFYKNGVAHLPCKTVHEQAEVKGEVGFLKSNLIHYPFPSFSFYLNKWDRYSTQEAELLYKKGVRPGFTNFMKYFVVKPKVWFLMTYFRHKGFQDGFAGFVFSLFSAIQNWATYIKLVELSHS
jgi:glycosyltransferase involved in cell wall biosynthesis